MTLIRRVEYVLAVPDLQRSVRYYRDVLGFKPEAIEDSGWMFMHRDGLVIRLGECKDAIKPDELGDHSYFAFWEVDDADAWYEQIKAAGGKVLRPPSNQPWGMREFPIVTVDGHRIMLGQQI